MHFHGILGKQETVQLQTSVNHLCTPRTEPCGTRLNDLNREDVADPTLACSHLSGGSTPVVEHGFIPPDRLFTRTLTTQRSRHLRLAYARSASTILNPLPLPTVFPCAGRVSASSVLQPYRAE